MSTIHLNVPFKDKDAARELGAVWNPEERVWCVTTLADLTPFRKWLPTGTPLMRIFLQVEEDKKLEREKELEREREIQRERDDKAAAFAFEKTKGEAANIFAIANYLAIDYNNADAVCAFIYMFAWPRDDKTIAGMHIVHKYASERGITTDEAVKLLKKLRVPYEYGAGRVC